MKNHKSKIKILSLLMVLAVIFSIPDLNIYAQEVNEPIKDEYTIKNEMKYTNAVRTVYGKSVQGRELAAYTITNSKGISESCRVVVNGKVNVRSGAGKKYKVLSTLKNGERVTRIDKNVRKADGYVWDKVLLRNGKSGYVANCYLKRLGDNRKTLLMTFAVHGFEDEYYRDGQALCDEAMKLIDYFDCHTEELKNYRLVIVPCVNPDGVVAGKNNQRDGKAAFGRCTAAHIDINRDFGSFNASESRSLRDFIEKVKPDIYLDVYGWLDETIGDKQLGGIVSKALDIKNRINNYPVQKGYIIDWVHKKYDIPTVLVEYASAESISTENDKRMIRSVISADFSSSSGSGGMPTSVSWKNGKTSENVYRLNDFSEKCDILKAKATAVCYGKSGKSYVLSYAYGKKHKAGFVKYSGSVKNAPSTYAEYRNGSTIEAVYADTAKKRRVGTLSKNERCKCLARIDGMYLVVYNVTGSSKQKCGFVSYNGIVK